MKKAVFITVMFISGILSGQNFSTEVAQDTSTVQRNKNYLTFFIGLNGYSSYSEAYPKNQQLTFTFGVEYTYRLSKVVRLSSRLEYYNLSLKVNQDSATGFPITSPHDEIEYSLNGLSLSPGINLVIPRNHCASSQWATLKFYGIGEVLLSRNLVVSGKLDNATNPFAQSYRTTYSKIKYINTFQYGIGGEISTFKFSLGVKYYLSNLFNPQFIASKGWSQAPKFVIFVRYFI